ncbi:3-hydroxypropionyl-coenzyme A dehydratase (3-hydroxypropionyl-CoA dehydratase) [Durusdinium trenchii]|uniref:3-hydroxypropionyl-coenzyme A dehydratase (3-hydroxypropionyl-CoA dehydratase) n=1 Tax=Durusdinium trenchii TaxID=1381693 RepID=A0ABP0IEU9_9DINO
MERLHKLSSHLRGVHADSREQVAANPTAAAQEPEVLYEVVEGGVAIIRLNRPSRLNALTGSMQAAYFDTLDQANADPLVRVIVVTGSGRGFCAGAEMDLLKTIGSKDGEVSKVASQPKRDLRQTQALAVLKPIIAAINGPVAGLGFVLATMCDIRFAVEKAKFTSAFAKRGLVAEHGISWMLPKVVGASNANDILMSSRVFLGHEAKEMGFVTRVYPDQETLMREVLAYARDMAVNCSPAALAEMKVQVYDDFLKTPLQSIDHANGLMAKSFAHPDSKEGVASYVEKRAPNFQGLAFGRIMDTTP